MKKCKSNNYELSYLKMENDKPSFNLFLFKVNGNGKISDIYHFGEMRKTSSDAIKTRIIKTEPFWTLPKDVKEYKWVAIPYFIVITSRLILLIIAKCSSLD